MSGPFPRIPAMRSPNGHPIRSVNGQPAPANVTSRLSKLDLLGARLEPGKFYGRFLSDGYYYYLYGSWMGDSVAVHREESREGDPVVRAYLLPSGAWWIKTLVFGQAAYGLKRFADNFTTYAAAHPDLSGS
ncbi:hypothetical protein [Natronoglycomyces albus]|uniref:Uncharacterized protein n=1 Tax=Natronoglycomyces albus TaxID=2811108 RepID=A0A895XQQ5_9ACTN|nr:hypothetical protein [Natronoglycomyces albus]QSB05485.1 hypothetical protein JQS30_00630 [Natronoglycomyces albus]